MALTPLQKLSITGGAALVVVGLFGATSYYYASRLLAADRAVERTNEHIAAALRIVTGTQEGERATKAYVVRPDSLASTALQGVQTHVEDAIDIMAKGSEDNPHQRTLLGELATQVAESFDEFRKTVALRDRAGADSARRYLMRESTPHKTDSLMKIVAQMRDEELRVLAEETRHQTITGSTALRIILVGMAFTFLLVGVALQPMRRDVHARLTSHLTTVDDDAAGDVPARDDPTATDRGKLHALQRLVAALADANAPATAARAIVELGVAPLGAALSAVIVPNGAGGFTVLAASDPGFDTVTAALAPPVAETLRTGAAAMTESRSARERLYGTLGELDSRGAAGAVLFAPMTRNAVTNGVLVAAFAGDRVFGDDELTYAATLGRLGGPAVASRPLVT